MKKHNPSERKDNPTRITRRKFLDGERKGNHVLIKKGGDSNKGVTLWDFLKYLERKRFYGKVELVYEDGICKGIRVCPTLKLSSPTFDSELECLSKIFFFIGGDRS